MWLKATIVKALQAMPVIDNLILGISAIVSISIYFVNRNLEILKKSFKGYLSHQTVALEAKHPSF